METEAGVYRCAPGPSFTVVACKKDGQKIPAGEEVVVSHLTSLRLSSSISRCCTTSYAVLQILLDGYYYACTVAEDGRSGRLAVSACAKPDGGRADDGESWLADSGLFYFVSRSLKAVL